MQLAIRGTESTGQVFHEPQSAIQTEVNSIVLSGCDQFSAEVSEEQRGTSPQLHQ